MILSLTVAACADSLAYVMVSCTCRLVVLPTRGLVFVGGLLKCLLVPLPPKGESLAEGPLCSFQAWWLTYFGKGETRKLTCKCQQAGETSKHVTKEKFAMLLVR